MDPAVWEPLLVRRLELQRRRTVVAVAGLAGLSVALLVLVLLVTDGRVLTVIVWATVAGQLISLVWASGERRRQRLAGMLDRLPASTPPAEG